MDQGAASSPDPTTGAATADTPRGGARAVLGLACLAFFGVSVVPVALVLAFGWIVALVFAASFMSVRGGGLAVARDVFESLAFVASAAALVGLLRVVLVKIAKRGGSNEQTRQRVIGPGGRIIRSLYRPKDEGPIGAGVAATVASWLPEPWLFTSLLAIGFFLQKHVGVRFPAWLVAVVVLTNLYLFALRGLTWLALGAVRLPIGAYRFGVKTAYRTGALTAALGIIAVGFAGGIAVAGQWVSQFKDQPVDNRFDDLPKQLSFAETTRLLLVGLGEIVEPSLTLKQDLAGFLAPIFERARRDRVDELASEWMPTEGVLLASLGTAGIDGPGPQARFQECMSSLWPEEFRKVESSIRKYTRIARDEKHDIALSALIDTCEAYTKGRVDSLAAFFQTTTNRRAIDWHRKSKYVACTEVDLSETCPGPLDDPDTRIAREAALAQIEWCQLRPLEQALLLEHFVLEFDYQEVAERHPGMSATKAKDATNNIIKKVRDKLGGRCIRDYWDR